MSSASFFSDGSVITTDLSFYSWQPRANLAINAPYSAESWLLDSGACHHLMSDLNNLSLLQQYHSGEDVIINDGTTLPITHTGSHTLPSSTRDLFLNKILCVPNVHRNLISVYRLCNTNSVSVEFFPAFFQVKDLSTGVPLLPGNTITNGRYQRVKLLRCLHQLYPELPCTYSTQDSVIPTFQF